MYETVGFLHDVIYEVNESDKIQVKSLASYPVMDDKIQSTVINHDEKLNEVSFTASVSILIADGIMDLEGKLIKH
jgi:hypothetical protein